MTSDFKAYLRNILKFIPTLKITGMSMDGYSYNIEINSRVLYEACQYGTVEQKMVQRLKKCGKIAHLKYNGISECGQNTCYIVEFKNIKKCKQN